VSHPSPDALWAQAQAPVEALGSHLEGCPDCRAQLADIRRAQAALALLPPPPPLSGALAARVGARLAEAADRQAMRRRPWWAGLGARPALVAAAAGVAMLAAWGVSRMTASSPAVREVAPFQLAQPSVAPAPEVPGRPPGPKRSASVASARRARAQEAPAIVAQVLEEGSRLRTEPGGSLWLTLPDGSRAGLTGATAVTLKRLETSALELEVSQGSLALVVPHRSDRLLLVRAGEVEVRDLGTRFSVSRTTSRVLVAVEEGTVEVRTPAGVQTVAAGRALSAHDGKVDTFAWAPVVERASPQALFVPTEAARLSDEDAEDEPAAGPSPARPAATVASPEDEWASLPQTARARAAPPPPSAVTTATRRPPFFSLDALERRVREFTAAFITPAVRQSGAREVTRRGKRGDCVGVIAAAERWLAEPPAAVPEEAAWREEVLARHAACEERLRRAASPAR
jgi:hypothetical protein